MDLPLCFQSFTISYFELGYFEFPAISNSSFFPYTLNQPRYFEVNDGDDGNEDEQQEETPKPPTKIRVLQAIETLSRYSLFAVEGAEIRRQTSQLSFTIDKSIRKKNNNNNNKNIQRFFNVIASADFSDN